MLLGLGPDLAAQVFKHLGDTELRQVALGAKNLRRQAKGAVAEALRSFVETLQFVGGDAVAGDEPCGPSPCRRWAPTPPCGPSTG